MRKIDMHRLQELVRLHREGRAVREVARLLKMSPNTEREYRKALRLAGLLEGSEDDLPELATLRAAVEAHLPAKTPKQQVSSVESWSTQIVEMAERGAGPKAIWDTLRLRDDDFVGSYDAVKRLYRQWKRNAPPDPNRVAIPVETKPGAVAQVDFGYIGKLYDTDERRMRRAWVFVMVLGYSRHMFCRIVFDQKTTTWLRLHIEAFAALGGVPAALVPDNLKSAVIRAAFGADRDDTALNRSYRDLARHSRFTIDPAPSQDPRKKGKVEAGVKYVKRNFFKPRALEDAVEAQAELDRWVREIAGLREHGTMGWQPIVVFDQEERQALKALPAHPYVPVEWKKAKVHPNSHILFDKREYSVHWTNIGREVWVRATPDTVAIYVDDERVQTHDRRGNRRRSTVEADLPEHRRDLRHRSRGYWVDRAGLIDPTVATYIDEVFDSDDVLSQLRSVQSIVMLLEKHPTERAIAACERARFFGNHSYRGVRDILRKGLDMQPLPMTLFAGANGTTHFRPRFSRVPATKEAQSEPN